MNDERDGYGFEAERHRGEGESGADTETGADAEGVGGAGGTTLPFGPHAGRRFDEIAAEDPDYLVALVHLGLGSSELRLAAARAVLRREVAGGASEGRGWRGVGEGRTSLAAQGDMQAGAPAAALATRDVEPGPLARGAPRDAPTGSGRGLARPGGGVRLLGRWDCALALLCVVAASVASLTAWRLWDRGVPSVERVEEAPVTAAGAAGGEEAEASLQIAREGHSSGGGSSARPAAGGRELPAMDDGRPSASDAKGAAGATNASGAGTPTTSGGEAPAGVDPSAPCGARVAGAIPADSAPDFLDSYQAVEFEVVATKDTGRVTFLNSNPDYRNHFYVAIFPDDYAAFPAPPAEHFRGRCVVIQGRIELYRGSPQIVVREPGDIRVVNGG